MWRKIFNITIRVRTREISASTAADEILSLMGEKETGGSGALPSNGDLHGVRECNVSGAESDKEASVNCSLEKITDTDNKCEHNYNPVNRRCIKCNRHMYHALL